MSRIRTICAVSGTRADFGLLRWTLEAVLAAPDLGLQLLVTGAHLDSNYGNSLAEIRELGFTIDAEIELGPVGDSPLEISRALGQATQGFARALDRLKPDILLILGDRYEILAAAQAAMVAGVPICHLHGGESTEGLIDEAMRHAITKMSHIHCVAAESYGRRVRQLGEAPAAVHVVGATGLDAIAQLDLLDATALAAALGYAPGKRHLLVTYHPVTLLHEDPRAALQPLLDALDAFPGCVVTITGANADAGGRALNRRLAAYADSRPNAHFTPSLGQLRYLSLARLSAAVVGNSSSGLIEIPALGVPTVNIGERQRNRLRAPSVIDCANASEQIVGALRAAMSDAARHLARQRVNPYGSPGAAGKIVAVLRKVALDGILLKHFHDWVEPL